MKDKDKTKNNINQQNKKDRRNNVLAFILCVLISMAIWVYVANRDVLRAHDSGMPPAADAVGEQS